MPRKRRRSTWGSNEDAGSGRRRLRYWADLRDGRGYARHSMTIVGTRREGDDMLARLRVEHSEDHPCPTLSQAWEAWLLPELEDRVETGDLARRSLSVYKSVWRKHIEPVWGDTHVKDIRPLGVQTWLSGLATSAAQKSLTLLSQVLSKCVMYEVAETNVAKESYRMPRKVERVASKDVYNLDEMVAAIEAVRGTVAYIPAVLCGLASCRVGEAMGPMAGDVRSAEVDGMTVAVVDIRRQVGRDGVVSDRLKTKQSARPVIVPEPWSLDVLAVEPDVGGWLCGDGCGEPVKTYAVTKAWRETLGAAGIEPIPLRNLRNSWRTYMRWELGVPEDLLEAMMGHSGKNVGEVHYDRPRWEVFARTVADAWVRYRAGRNDVG